ncbi:MAG: hypothetical protein H0U99_05555 [Chthoniobacterales bacterium]|nr:hypothetical protein [Chthoniobacterales bacterium]
MKRNGHTNAGSQRGAARFFPPRPVMGLEAEFQLIVDGVRQRPEEIFGSPTQLVRRKMIPRTGRSFQLPAGGAIYFDTGVIEVATPIVELEPGCCYRATRLLWEQIRYVRQELDRWSLRHKCDCRLQGFSAHYNFSFPTNRKSRKRNSTTLGFLLAHILPVPVMLLATNRKSSAIGVRPRRTRLEVTTDFTPDAALMLATSAFVAGTVETMLQWSDYGLRQIAAHDLPRLMPFRLRKHSSRRGWRMLSRSVAQNPFTADINAPIWSLRDRRSLSLREIAAETVRPFEHEIRRLSDATTLEHIKAVFRGDARSLLDFNERPDAYEDAGRTIDWNRRRVRRWSRSAYERVIHRVIERKAIQIGGKRYTVQRMQGWYEVVFRETKTGRRRVLNLDELVGLTKGKRAAAARKRRTPA